MKKKKWIKARHAVVTRLAYIILSPYCRWKYGITIEKFVEKRDEPYLILFNHQTAFDQFFVSIACFAEPIYYFASEDIFSLGWVSSLLRWLVAPIPIKKQTTDVTAMKNCFQVVKEGGTIAIAPEGNRTYSGKTEYINPAIARLARKLKLPIALFRIEGGYGVQPRWSDAVRKGSMRAYVSRVLEPAEYLEMSNEELQAVIEKELYVNEAQADGMFYHRRRAEYLERAMYICPFCGLSVFESRKERIECTICHRKLIYRPDKGLEGVGYEFPFAFVNEWYEYQQEFIHGLDLSVYSDTAMYQDRARLSEVIVRKCKKLLRKNAEILLYGNRIEIDAEDKNPLTIPFEEISVITVLGKNKLNIYHQNIVYQLKGDKRFNALKYVNIFYHYRNVRKGETDGKFLGL